MLRRSSSLPSQYVPNLQFVGALDLDFAPGLADELIPDQAKGVAGNLDALALPLRFHPACDVHGIAPEVVDEFLAANDAGDHWAGIDADAERKFSIAEFALRHRRLHIEGQIHNYLGVVRA